MNAIVRSEPAEHLPVSAGSGGPPTSDVGALMAVIERAAGDPSFDPARLMQLLEVKERWEATEARKAFVRDMAEFKKNPPVIFKNKHVGFDSRRTGQTTEYDHATHAEVTYKIIAGLAQHGFSHRWVTTQPGGNVQVECVITHRLGHSESFSMVAPPDNSGNKSPVQAIASTKTLLERYTLLGATGLSTTDLPDADDRKTGDDEPADDKVPELAQDVVNVLKDAAKLGTAELGAEFQKLAEKTRALIVLHYSEEWTALKADAAKVKKGARS